MSDSICSITAGILTKLGVCNAISVKSGVGVFVFTSVLPNIYGVILSILFCPTVSSIRCVLRNTDLNFLITRWLVSGVIVFS